MNCTKCGKEITEEGKTICDECQKKLIDEIKNEEEKKSPEEKEKFKVSKEGKEKKSSLKVIIILLILVALIGVIGYLVYTGKIYINKVGSEIGNIRNYGYAVKDGDTIYYLSPNEASTQVGIFTVNSNGDDKKELYIGESDILSLNSYGDHLYFITIASTENPDEYDNKICRIKKDGTNFEVLNDNEFNDYCFESYVVNGKIYYIGEDSNIYKMDLNGGNRQLVSDTGTGYVGITDKYIIYNTDRENASEGEDAYKTCIMNLDGTNKRDIIENKRLYTVNVVNDTIFYTDENLELYSVNMDGTNNKKLLNGEVYKLIASGNYLYYLNYADIENNDETICIYRSNLDGSDNKIIKRLDSGTSFINVVGDWVLFMDSTLEAGYIKIIKLDGSEEKILYTLDFKNLYDQMNETNVQEDYITGEESNEISNEINNAIVSNETVGNVTNTTVQNNTAQNNTAVNNSISSAKNTATNSVNNTNTATNAVSNTTTTNTSTNNKTTNTTTSNNTPTNQIANKVQ